MPPTQVEPENEHTKGGPLRNPYWTNSAFSEMSPELGIASPKLTVASALGHRAKEERWFIAL